MGWTLDYLYDELRNHTDKIDQNNASLVDSLMVVKYDVSENKKFLDYLEQVTMTNETMIRDLLARIDENRYEIYNLHERANQIDSISVKLSELNEFVSNIAHIDIDNIENIIGDRLNQEIDKRIEDLQRDIIDNVKRIYDLEDKINSNSKLTNYLEIQTITNTTIIEDLRNRCDKFEQMIFENKQSAELTEQKLMWYIEQLQKEVEELKNK